MNEVYADTSALTKLVVAEAQSAALRSYLEAESPRVSASSLVRVEVARAARIRAEDVGNVRLRELFETVSLLPVDDEVLALAAQLADASLRSIDAIHLGSALTIGASRMLVYDRRLAEAAASAGIEIVAPA